MKTENKYVKVDKWVEEILRDPLDKSELHKSDNYLYSNYGSVYEIINGICDLRPYKKFVSPIYLKWFEGQQEMEYLTGKAVEEDSSMNYEIELTRDAKVYEEININGRCLDVGGSLGRLRTFLKDDQEYLIIDPFINIFDKLDRRINLLKTYPALSESVNFITGYAEHLPLLSSTFDTVHIRSCIDHLYNPELALAEARRVLKNDGEIIIGTFVLGGKTGKLDVKSSIKELVKNTWLYQRMKGDYHIWHPTYRELIRLIEINGFKIEKVHWMESIKDVCYIKARKIVQPLSSQRQN